VAGWWVKKVGSVRFEPFHKLDALWRGIPLANWLFANSEPTLSEDQGVLANVSGVQINCSGKIHDGEMPIGMDQGGEDEQLRSRQLGRSCLSERGTLVGGSKFV